MILKREIKRIERRVSWKKMSVRKNHGGMSFKDPTIFNVAMLGKQRWKFQTDHTSLVARLFKAHYFPNTDFIGSRLGHNPSYVRRSIFSVKMVVKKGTRWQIGTSVNNHG